MPKNLTSNQILGEIGENVVRGRFLSVGFQFDVRSRLEAGIDGIAEVMDRGRPLARMIAVQVKSTEAGKYVSENERGFSYLLRSEDLSYWRGSNLPVIIVLYRNSDGSIYWKEVPRGINQAERRLHFDKLLDKLDRDAVDRLAALTVPKAGIGYYVPPLGGGEEALVNILPVTLPSEMFVTTTPYSGRNAVGMLLENADSARFDWVIRGDEFWSFHDPRTSSCRDIIDHDQVEAIDTEHLAQHEDISEQNHFIFLLRNALKHQVREDLNWNKDRKLLYFKALEANKPRNYVYDASKKKTDADVVNVSLSEKEEGRIDFVRHHAFVPRFERLGDQWYLVINPTYYFTTNGFIPHSYPGALLAGKKRMDKSGSIRGQVIMWHRFLTATERAATRAASSLFEEEASSEPRLIFGAPPAVYLRTRVPEDAWSKPKKKGGGSAVQEGLLF